MTVQIPRCVRPIPCFTIWNRVGQITTSTGTLTMWRTTLDSVVNRLIEQGGLQPGLDTVVGYVVQSSADYFSPISYPTTITLGLRVQRMGTKSVRWEVGVFAPGSELSSVTGTFTHAFVDRDSGRSAPVPEEIRCAIQSLPGRD